MKWLTRLVLPVLILLIGAASANALNLFSRESSRAEPEERVLPVAVQPLSPARARARMVLDGVVQPARQVTIIPEVGGQIRWLSEELLPGGRLSRGDTLARIDARDYRLVIQQQESQVRRAEMELELEQARGEVAEREWALLGDAERTARLALREPQLEVAQASLAAAEAGLERARLSLERTSLRAPFNAVVIERRADVGQLVGPATPVATLVGTDEVWVRCAIPVQRLEALDFPEGSQPGSLARVQQLGVPGAREGRVLRLGGQLDPQTRTAEVLIEVSDPMTGAAPLLPGAFVEVQIEGAELNDSFEVPRSAVYEGNTVWIAAADDTLERREIEIAWRDEEQLIVTDGLSEGDRLVVSPLALPIDGTKVSILETIQ